MTEDWRTVNRLGCNPPPHTGDLMSKPAQCSNSTTPPTQRLTGRFENRSSCFNLLDLEERKRERDAQDGLSFQSAAEHPARCRIRRVVISAVQQAENDCGKCLNNSTLSSSEQVFTTTSMVMLLFFLEEISLSTSTGH